MFAEVQYRVTNPKDNVDKKSIYYIFFFLCHFLHHAKNLITCRGVGFIYFRIINLSGRTSRLTRFRVGVYLLGFDFALAFPNRGRTMGEERNTIPWTFEIERSSREGCQGILKSTVRSSARWHWYTIRDALRINVHSVCSREIQSDEMQNVFFLYFGHKYVILHKWEMYSSQFLFNFLTFVLSFIFLFFLNKPILIWDIIYYKIWIFSPVICLILHNRFNIFLICSFNV